jgi:hypothetical protein
VFIFGTSCTGESFEMRVMNHESPETVYSTRKTLVISYDETSDIVLAPAPQVFGTFGSIYLSVSY